ncbi:MAG TPA: hypothetical protein DET40_19405 [Lentisphaeria bacterium]|nr:MAG: hypothetical protein A2X45_18235 [Lentisphaerae bacterium GWF2_50_93]HCE45715.1 hypothetical protein [Lentisphaeria bacterium]
MKKIVLLAVSIALSFGVPAWGEEKKPDAAADLNSIKQRFDKEAVPYFTGDKATTLLKAGGGAQSVAAYTLVPMLEGIIIYKGAIFNGAKPELIKADAMIDDVTAKFRDAEGEVDKAMRSIEDSNSRIKGLENDMDDLELKIKKESDDKTRKRYTTMLFQNKNDASDLKKEIRKIDKDVDKKKKDALEIKNRLALLKTTLAAYIAKQRELGGGAKKEDREEDKKDDVKKDQLVDPFK